MRRETFAAAGSIGASLLIASCCLGPTLFLLFGVSIASLGHLSALEVYRPYFILAGGAALLYAAWGAWSATRASAPGEDCSTGTCAPTTPRSTRGVVLLALALYLVSIAYPWILAHIL
jgi:mercuric ion transport protein